MKKNRFILTLIILMISVFIHTATQASNALWVTPSNALKHQDTLNFWTGYSFFKAPWVFAPSSTVARDGLGPLFNARACESCHIHGSAGIMPPPQTSDATPSHTTANDFVVRIANQADENRNTFIDYGSQLQTLSQYSLGNNKAPLPEADIAIKWLKHQRNQPLNQKLPYQDLKKPTLIISQDHYKKLPQSLSYSIRLAPALYGVGLVDLLEPAALLAHADPNDLNNDGISGRANAVWDIKKSALALGKFGLKAEQPTLEQQNASAFIEDIGITSRYFPQQNCTRTQAACQKMPNGNSLKHKVELIDSKLALVTQFTQYLKAPNSQYQPVKVEPLFIEVDCHLCHLPRLPLPASNIFKQHTLHAYSDFLLHDLGDGLSDGRTWANTQPNEWRTTPLWGLSRKLKNIPVSLLHDGRARTIREAIVWHGGEARNSRDLFLALSPENQNIIIHFLSQL
ncbi:di-heme oxidoredictase family protein [Marinagarivorans algicola]|uniref:di-heme oxidoredictase family protein n=1 Tax=Marinagarivorans algicola TaxID=1513270 RepID=UPI0006B4FF08|nr:di-heme oxidoredictase family protein [Marinagarivorans algicola]